MNKKEFIERRGEAAYQKKLEQSRVWDESHPQEAIAHSRERNRKGGKHYDKKLIYRQTGLQGEREKIRDAHGRRYRQYKKIISPDSQIHHEWIPETSEYRGVALVEKDQHMHGIIDVFMILDGEITVFDEHAGVYK